MKQEFCRNCRAIITPAIIERAEMQEFRGERFEIQAKVSVCPTCQQEFITQAADGENLRTLQEAYRKKYDRLSPESIVRIRTKYAPNQISFAQILGVGDKTIARYESGQVPDEVFSNLIRALDQPCVFKVFFDMNRHKLRPLDLLEIGSRLDALLETAHEECVYANATTSWSASKPAFAPSSSAGLSARYPLKVLDRYNYDAA